MRGRRAGRVVGSTTPLEGGQQHDPRMPVPFSLLPLPPPPVPSRRGCVQGTTQCLPSGDLLRLRQQREHLLYQHMPASASHCEDLYLERLRRSSSQLQPTSRTSTVLRSGPANGPQSAHPTLSTGAALSGAFPGSASAHAAPCSCPRSLGTDARRQAKERAASHRPASAIEHCFAQPRAQRMHRGRSNKACGPVRVVWRFLPHTKATEAPHVGGRAFRYYGSMCFSERRGGGRSSRRNSSSTFCAGN